MPTDNRLRLYDHQGINNARRNPVEAGKNLRSKLLKASRFGDFLRSTLTWWRSVKISASSEALDRNSPMTAHQISLRMSPIEEQHGPIRGYTPAGSSLRYGQGPDHFDRKRKDQTTDNRQSPLAAPSTSRVTYKPDEPETLLFYTATCPKNSDDGQFNVQRHLVSARTHRAFRATAMQTRQEAIAL
jgi:hypothetical protein